MLGVFLEGLVTTAFGGFGDVFTFRRDPQLVSKSPNKIKNTMRFICLC